MNVVNKHYHLFAITFPRGPRKDYNLECSCSNSCEKVIELLLQDNEAISFEEKLLTFDINSLGLNIPENKKDMYKKTSNLCYLLINNRNLFLPIRIVLLGRILEGIQISIDNNLSINYDSIKIDFKINDYNIKKDINYSYTIQKKLLLHFSKKSPSIKPYTEQVLKYLESSDEIEQYLKAKQHFYEVFKDPEIMFEKILVNHMFFNQFPFSQKYSNLMDEFKSLCGVFMFIKFISICYMADKTNLEDFVDVISASFRLISHSNFDQNVSLLLKSENVETFDQLSTLIQA